MRNFINESFVRRILKYFSSPVSGPRNLRRSTELYHFTNDMKLWKKLVWANPCFRTKSFVDFPTINSNCYSFCSKNFIFCGKKHCYDFQNKLTKVRTSDSKLLFHVGLFLTQIQGILLQFTHVPSKFVVWRRLNCGKHKLSRF